MNLEEKTLSSKLIYSGKIINVSVDDVLLPNGKNCVREHIKNSGGACIIAEKDGCLFFVKQFRYPYKKVILELPAGKLNENEDPKICAIRELKEETGLTADNVTLLHSIYPTPAYTNEIIYIYKADNVVEGSTNFDEDEFLNLEKIPIDKVKEMLLNGEIHDAKTIIALYSYFFNKK